METHTVQKAELLTSPICFKFVSLGEEEVERGSRNANDVCV